jgi:hypothetical protein
VTDKSEHGLAEIDDDGGPSFQARCRNYRYVCRCGVVGKWMASPTLAKGEHAVHKSDSKPVDNGRRERDGRSKAWTTGYAAALASVFRFGAVSGSTIRKTMVADGMTLAMLERDGVESYDMKRIREAWGHDHNLSKPRRGVG